MKTIKEDYTRHPLGVIQDDTMTIQYDIKTGNAGLIKHHVHIPDEDIRYIHHWLSRFVMDVSAKQFINPQLHEGMTMSDKDMPKSGYTNSYNSIISYASGIVGNRLRNPSQDYTKKQLKHIQKLFNTIYNCHNTNAVFNKQDLGYDLKTDIDNEKPYRIKFKLLGSK